MTEFILIFLVGVEGVTGGALPATGATATEVSKGSESGRCKTDLADLHINPT